MIKMSKMGEMCLDGYMDFVVLLLEGFWWFEERFDLKDRDVWFWIFIFR